MSNNSTQNEEALAYVQVCHQSFANVKHEDATSNAVVEFLSKFVAPPKLILLWVMSTLTKKEVLDFVECVHQCLSSAFPHNPPPMIGTTVRACLVDGKVQERGAVLVGIASHHLEITTCMVQSIGKHPRTTAEEFLDSLQISTSSNTRQTKWHKTIVHAYLTDSPSGSLCRDIVEEISCLTDGRLKMLGGGAVSIADIESGLVIEGGNAFADALVAAKIVCHLRMGLESSDCLVNRGNAREPFLNRRRPKTVSVVSSSNGVLLPQENFKSISGQVFVSNSAKKATESQIASGGRCYRAEPCSRQMVQMAGTMHERILRQLEVESSRVVKVLAISSQHRLAFAESQGVNLEGVLRETHRRFGDGKFLCAYLAGEIGIDNTGKPIWTHWSLTEFALADFLTDGRHGQLLRNALNSMVASTGLRSVDNTIEAVLDLIRESGHNKAMISLLFEDGNEKWVVAQSARGENWRNLILPDTRRKLGEGDVLELAITTKATQYIWDAQTDERCTCRGEEGLASIAGIHSFIAVPLFNDHGKSIGVIQIDLGDMRQTKELLESFRTRLESLASIASLMINQAIYAEELRFARRLDEILKECTESESIEAAYSHFVKQAARELNVNVHIRRRKEDDFFHLVDGQGPYYEACRQHRVKVRYSDEVRDLLKDFEFHEILVINDARKDPVDIEKLEANRSNGLGKALESIGSHANFPIQGTHGPIQGVVCFSSEKSWYFSTSKLRSWRDIGKKLSLLEGHMEQKAAKEKRMRELAFLREMSLPLNEGLHAYAALHQQMERIATSSNAHVVSCFLREDMRRRYVLRAQYGWKDPDWRDAAWIDEQEPVLGSQIANANPIHIPDVLNEFGTTREKYLAYLFLDEFRADETYETICLPLHFQSIPLGLVVLYRRKTSPIEHTGFTTIEPSILTEAREVLSALVAALNDFDDSRWREQEVSRRLKVSEALHSENQFGVDQHLRAYCQAIVDQFRFRRCSIYLVETNQLNPWTQATRDNLAEIVLPDDQVRLAIRDSATKVVRAASTTDQASPTKVRNEQLVERVVFPVMIEGKAVAVLDLEWKGSRPSAARQQARADGATSSTVSEPSFELPHHDENELRKLAELLGSFLSTEYHAARAKLSKTILVMLDHRMGNRFHSLSQSLTKIRDSLKTIVPTDTYNDPNSNITKIVELADAESAYLRSIKYASESFDGARREKVDLKKLLHDVLEMVGPSLEGKGIRTPEKWRVDSFDAIVDPEQISECISNAIQNAARYLPTNGGAITISLLYDPSHDVWEFECIDNGPGVQATQSQSRLENSESPDEKGSTGIGNFLAKLYCESHNGTYHVEVGPLGVGTKVSMRLPLVETYQKLLRLKLDG